MLYMYSYNLMVKSVSSKDLLSIRIRLTVVFKNILLFFLYGKVAIGKAMRLLNVVF